MSTDYERYLAAKRQSTSGQTDYERYLAAKQQVAPPESLSQLRLEPRVEPAATTRVDPSYQEAMGREPHFGMLPKGTTQKVLSAIAGEQLPVPKDLPASEKVRRTAVNLVLGAQKFAPGMVLGALEEPYQVPRALAEFIPTLINRIHKATGGLGLAGKYGLLAPKEKEAAQARRELTEEPFDVALLALPSLLKGL